MNPQEKIKIVTAHVACCMCPTIVVGTTTEGSTIYCRYRWGHLTVRLDPRDPAPHDGAAGRWIFEKQLDPEGIQGAIDYDELRQITSVLIDWPEKPDPQTNSGAQGRTWPDDFES